MVEKRQGAENKSLISEPIRNNVDTFSEKLNRQNSDFSESDKAKINDVFVVSDNVAVIHVIDETK